MALMKISPKQKTSQPKRIAILGIGSELRGDDAAGILAVRQLKPQKNFKVFIGETAPENLTGEIKRFKPTDLIIIDSVDTRKIPGTITLFSPQETTGISFCTHNLPIRIMADYLIEALNCKIVIIGIQPKTLVFGNKVSSEVKKAIKSIPRLIKQIC